jgi:transcription initiation factor TFIIE subunit beta
MRLQDLAIVTNTPLDTDPLLLEKFRAHDKIHWDVKTDLYSYKVCISSLFPFITTDAVHSQHEFNFRNKAALLVEIQRHTRKGGGIPVRALKDSWKDVSAITRSLNMRLSLHAGPSSHRRIGKGR